MTGHNGRCSGAIGIIDPQKRQQRQEAITNVTPEVDIGKVTISTNGPAAARTKALGRWTIATSS